MVPLAVGKQLPTLMGHKNRGASRDSVNDSRVPHPLEFKANRLADTDVELPCRSFRLRHQVMAERRMTKNTSSDILKRILGTRAIVPNNHLQQMRQLMFHHAL